MYYCNDCYKTKQRAAMKNWRHKNLEHSRQLSKESYYKNRELIIQHKRDYRLRNIEEMRRRDKIKAKKYKYNIWYRNLLEKYDLTPDDFWVMWKYQKGRCAMCDTIMVIGKKPIQKNTMIVDHNHTDGTVRGLLCNNCNKILGIIEKNLPNAMKYLQPQP